MAQRRTIQGLVALLLLIVLAACAPKASSIPQVVDNSGSASEATGAPQMEQPESEVVRPGAASDGAAEPMEEPADYDDAPSLADREEDGFAAPPADERGSGGGGGDSVIEAEPSIAGDEGRGVGDSGGEALPPDTNFDFTPPDQQFLPLTAGEIDDNADFGSYLQYRLDFDRFMNIPIEDLDVTERHIIAVYNEDGLPVLDAEVSIYEGQRLLTVLRTPADGKVYFFPRAYSRYDIANDYTIYVEKDQASVDFNLSAQGESTLTEVDLDVASTRPPVQLDVLFLIDSTGSMGDEIDELKDNILSISAQIEALPSEPDVRFGMVTYRDRGDRYVTRVTDFTSDIQYFQAELLDVDAAGGQDAPESLNEALHDAIHEVSWRGDDTVRLVFLVADAPPHLDYPQDYSYAQELAIAVEEGITIHPIASRLCQHRDDCDDDLRFYQEQAEYVFRQMAQFTGGHFIFLTYEDTPDSSGEPGSEVHVPEDEYTVADLDALVVRLVQNTLAALMGDQTQ